MEKILEKNPVYWHWDNFATINIKSQNLIIGVDFGCGDDIATKVIWDLNNNPPKIFSTNIGRSRDFDKQKKLITLNNFR